MTETGGGQMNNIYTNGFQLRIEDDNLILLLFLQSQSPSNLYIKSLAERVLPFLGV